MKYFYLVLCMMFLYPASLSVSAQCPTCTPDANCTSPDGFPTICPQELPPAVAGVYYEQYLTFFLPATVIDPDTELEATLNEVYIASVTGMPYGMSFAINDPDATYYPSQGENLGCATICGTPILEGVYDIVITVNVIAVVFGFEVPQTQQFIFTFVVEPGEVGNATFTMSGGPAGCGELTINCNGLINAAPSVTAWSWNFGNGQTSQVQNPGNITFDQAGEYTISLTTTISDYTLSAIAMSGLNDNWSGDVDDFFSDSDTFFILYDGDGNAVYTSGTVDNNNTPSWSGFSVILNNPPYSITFIDDDDISGDDNLGTATLSIDEGSVVFNAGNGTVGTSTIGLVVSSTFNDSETVTVFPMPDAEFNVIGNVLSYSDPELTGFIWFRNGLAIEGELSSSLTLGEGGQYSCQVTNIYGCTGYSETYLYCPEITPVYDPESQTVSVDPVFDSYQWYFNGLPVNGATENIIDASEPGNYSVELATDYGCETESDVITVTVNVGEQQSFQLAYYPNPANDFLTIDFQGSGMAIAGICNISGQEVMQFVIQPGALKSVDLTSLSSGVYFLKVNAGGQTQRHKLVIR